MRTLSFPVEDELDQALERLSAQDGRQKVDLLSEAIRTYVGTRERRERAAQLQAHLIRIAEERLVTMDAALQAWRIWETLSAATHNALLVPDAAPGPDGQLLYAWDDREHHLELELFPDGRAEFFCRNRETGSLWGADFHAGDALPVDALKHLERYYAGACA